MIIGVPKEIKVREYRVGLVPGGVKELVGSGHKVFIEKGAGEGVGLSDDLYKNAGASLCTSAQEVWEKADMLMKVKEPIKKEYELFKENQILYTYLHLAAEPELTNALLEKQVSAVAYETIQSKDGSLPLLKPMSEVAGRMAVQVGSRCLEKPWGGKGQLLGGVPGVRRGKVTIIGGGYVGVNAAKMAIGMGALVTILDIDQKRLAYIDDVFENRISTLMSNQENIYKSVSEADLVVGAVLVAGAKAPKLIDRKTVKSMEAGSAIVDVAIDQGGIVETIKATNHDSPTFIDEGVVHYGVTNMPGAVPQTSTYALSNVTLPYAKMLANLGIEKALEGSEELRHGLNTYKGQLTYEAVAKSLDIPFKAYN